MKTPAHASIVALVMLMIIAGSLSGCVDNNPSFSRSDLRVMNPSSYRDTLTTHDRQMAAMDRSRLNW